MYKKIISVMSVALVVFLCTSFPVFANTQNGAQYYQSFSFDLDNTSDDILRFDLYVTSFSYEKGSYGSNSTPYYYDTYTVYYRAQIVNLTDYDILLANTNLGLNFTMSSSYPASVYIRPTSIDFIGGGFAPSSMNNNGRVFFTPYSDSSMRNTYTLPAHRMLTCLFTITYTLDTYVSSQHYNAPQFNVTWNYPVLPANYQYVEDISYNDSGYIKLLFDKFVQFLNSYNANVPASQDVSSDASSSSSIIDNQHQQESNIYTQTNQAIGNTGIQNFQFDSQTIGGLGGVKNDFMAVWNALGSFNSVFITSLTIGLALSIVRHRRMFKQ